MFYNLYFENLSVTKCYSGDDGLTNITSSAVTPSRKYNLGVFSSGIPSNINAATAWLNDVVKEFPNPIDEYNCAANTHAASSLIEFPYQ